MTEEENLISERTNVDSDRQPTKGGKTLWSRFVDAVAAFEAHPVTKLLLGVTAVVGFVFAMIELREGRQANEQDAIARAWSVLATPARGNSGKVEAIEFLASRDVSLRGIDLSCEAMGGQLSFIDGFSDGEMRCSHLVELRGLDLSFETHGHLIDLTEANFSGITIASADFSGAALANASFRGAIIQDTVFDQAFLFGTNFDDVQWRNAIGFRGAFLLFARFDRVLPALADWECANLTSVGIRPDILERSSLEDANWLNGSFHTAREDSPDLRRMGSELFPPSSSRSSPERCDDLRPHFEDHGDYFTDIYPLLFPQDVRLLD